MPVIFVYNADSGKLNTWLDIGHKLISPGTYSCNLCALTHGLLTEREEWREFRDSSDVELVFLHRDEFEEQYGNHNDLSYPVVLHVQEDGDIEVLLASEEINCFDELSDLIAKIKTLDIIGK